jgi:periplasmic divalent cation tolerance protein
MPDLLPLPLLVVTTVGTRAEAEALAGALVDAGLAACAQIDLIHSVYRWQGAVRHEDEHRVLFKTVPSRYAEVEAAIRARHPYELPAIHAVTATAAYAPFARWVDENSQPPPVTPAG